MDEFLLNERARRLVENLVLPQKAESQSCSVTIYDTAWISMLTKHQQNGGLKWMFPEAFQFLIDRQGANGGWTTCDSKVDTILNTLAALLSMKRHMGNPQCGERENAIPLPLNVSRAAEYLQRQLSDWDPEFDMFIGSEILVPSLLHMLEREDVVFDIPRREKLLSLNSNSLMKYGLEAMQGSQRFPMHCFLEAFVGIGKFENLSQTDLCGSMMSSPSAIAGYMMGLQLPNKAAESFLRAAIQYTNSEGGVPAVFPCDAFEISLVVSTLLEHGFLDTLLDSEILNRIMILLQESYLVTRDVPSKSDVFSGDLFARCFMIQNICNEKVYALELEKLESQLIWHVENESSGFITKCTILKALMQSSRLRSHESYMSSLSSSLCDSWWTGKINDPQHLSLYHSMMLFTQAFAELNRLSDCGLVSSDSEKILKERAPVAIIQILAMILSKQDKDGSWGSTNCAETTAYSVLALISIATFPYAQILMPEIQDAITNGRRALSSMQDQWADPHTLWVRKVAYSSANLSKAYSLAAMKKPVLESVCSERSSSSMEELKRKTREFVEFFSSLEYMCKEPLYMIKASILEALFYRQSLQNMRAEVFPATKAKEKDKYIDYIPIMWVLPNTCSKTFCTPEYLLDMMVLSMYVFLADEYMESTVAQFSNEEFAAFKASLDEIHPGKESSSLGPPLSEGSQRLYRSGSADTTTPAAANRLQTAITVFRAFVTYTCSHPRVASASQTNYLEFRSETKIYLLHHLTQLEDNARLAQQPPPTSGSSNIQFLTPRTSYYNWVHTVGAGHVSGPWSFAFFTCAMSVSVRNGRDCFSTLKQKVLAHKMNERIGAFCRMYNDYGSIARDRAESNLNSVNFPEFFTSDDGQEGEIDVEKAKAMLLELAKYERGRALEMAEDLYGELEQEGREGRKIKDCLKIYMGACEQFSDMYVTRDVTNSAK